MTSERSKRRDFLSLIFIAKSISKKLLIKTETEAKNTNHSHKRRKQKQGNSLKYSLSCFIVIVLNKKFVGVILIG